MSLLETTGLLTSGLGGSGPGRAAPGVKKGVCSLSEEALLLGSPAWPAVASSGIPGLRRCAHPCFQAHRRCIMCSAMLCI